MKQFVEEISKYTPAWVQDVNYTKNPGFLRFKNGFVNALGKIQKRLGWEVKRAWTQPNKNPGQEGNLPLDYTYPVAGSDSCVRPDFIHVKSKTLTDGTVRKYCLIHRIINGQNALVKHTYDENGNFLTETQIATPTQFKNYGPVKFIETNDQVYIINSFNKLDSGKKQGYVWKYAYGDNLKNLDTDRLHNFSISREIFVQAEILNVGTAGLPVAKFYYQVIPVYNTGSTGHGDINANTTYAAGVTITNTTQKVVLKIMSAYDPYIIAYDIYRTKANKAVSDGVYFVCRIDKPDNNGNSTQLLELIDPKSPIYTISGVQRRVTDLTVSDTALGSSLNRVPLFNTFYHLWYNNGSRGQNPPSTVYDNALNFPVASACYAENRLILVQGNKIMFSLIDKTDSIDGTLTLLMPMAHETENPAVEVEKVGPWVYVWLQGAGIYKLLPTSSATTPFQLELVSGGESYGCDNLNGVCVLDGIAYFIHKKKLHAMNAWGMIKKDVNGPIASVFNTAVSEIQISKNEKEHYLKFMFRTETGSKEIDFWPDKNEYIDNDGYRDIFSPSDVNEVELLTKDQRLKLMAYDYNLKTGEEWGITFDGDVVRRGAEYVDRSQASAVTSWQDYQNISSTAPVDEYPVELLFEKAISYPERVQFPSAVLYGAGYVYFSYAIDASDNYSPEKCILLKRDGVDVVIDRQGFTCKVRIRHDRPENIDLDFCGVRVFASGKVDCLNTVTAGE